LAIVVSAALVILLAARRPWRAKAPATPRSRFSRFFRSFFSALKALVVGATRSFLGFIRFVSLGFWTVINAIIRFLKRTPVVGPLVDPIFFVISIPCKILTCFVAELRTLGSGPDCDGTSCQHADCAGLEKEVAYLERNVKKMEDIVGRK
jgi:hypothetical protein